MSERSIFGEAQGCPSDQAQSAGARTISANPSHGLFGMKLVPAESREAARGIGPGKLPRSLS
jgi:hypothetical protein